MRELEGRFANELVVVGVHSGKFRAERVTGNIAQAVQRLAVEHPVVNDRQYRIWRAYGVGAWPTIVLIDAQGGYVGSLPGEFLAGDLEPTLRELVAEADALGVLDRTPLPLTRTPEPDTPLLFPGKVLAAASAIPGSAPRVFVADTGHHRVVELELDLEDWRAGRGERPRARPRRVVGSGRRGRADGPLAEAAFDRPLGMALAPRGLGHSGAPGAETLYVADSENHLIRAVTLPVGSGPGGGQHGYAGRIGDDAGLVTTVVGTGLQARRFNQPGAGLSVALSTPWDLAIDESAGELIVAMAGFHQLWRIDLATLAAAPWVGTGREDLSDGPPQNCTLAQPTGVHRDSETGRVFIADCESSAVRVVERGRNGLEVRTLVGKGLFDFGDEDGKGGHVRLQHDYGVTMGPDGLLYVADTYNNKIKRIDPATGVSETFLGSGQEGADAGDALQARFDEPEGVAVAGGLLFVADTNNHVIRVTDLRDGVAQHGKVSTLELMDWDV